MQANGWLILVLSGRNWCLTRVSAAHGSCKTNEQARKKAGNTCVDAATCLSIGMS